MAGPIDNRLDKNMYIDILLVHSKATVEDGIKAVIYIFDCVLITV